MNILNILLTILMLGLGATATGEESWRIFNGSQWSLCQDAQKMLNELPSPKVIRNGRIPYSDRYPKFNPINLTPIEDYRPWLELFREYTEIYYSDSSSVEFEYQNSVRNIERYYKEGHFVFNRGDLDINYDGVKENIIWFGLLEYEDVSNKKGWDVFQNGLINLIPIVFDKHGRYVAKYKNHLFGYGYPFYYDGLLRFARLGGSVIERELPHSPKGTKISNFTIDEIFTLERFGSGKPYVGLKQVCNIILKVLPE